MNSQLLVAVIVSLLVFGREKIQAQSEIVWYQPTPYPAKQANGMSMPEDIKVVHTWNGWFNNSFNKSLVQDSKLQIGGWGDTYCSVIKFDLIGLPAAVDYTCFYLHAIPSGSVKPSQVSLWLISTPWSPSTVGWNGSIQVNQNGYYWLVSSEVNSWRTGYDITGWYNGWKNGTYQNNGILVWPYNGDGSQRFDRFDSSRVSAPTEAMNVSLRPILRFDFIPSIQFRIPLPGNHSWLVTTEIGGYDCFGVYNPYHDGNNYFSIDFSWRNIAVSGATTYTVSSDIPVIAAATGRVLFAGKDRPDVGNGYYVVLNHSDNVNDRSGFTTRYLHLKYPPSHANGDILREGDRVEIGDQIGVMGSTGTLSNGQPSSTGTHLHFGVRFNNSGASSTPELTRALLDGWLMKSFQTECSVDANGIPRNPSIRYYRSSNRVY